IAGPGASCPAGDCALEPKLLFLCAFCGGTRFATAAAAMRAARRARRAGAAAIAMEASMGIFDALTTAVTGLQAQSFALQNISGNIANSQTTGFKETNTSFQDLVTAATPNAQTSGSVLASSVATNSVQGAIQSEQVSTYMAINGDGYFIVARPTSVSGNQPVFNGVTLYTRRGDFQENAEGFLVNGA